MGHSTPSLASLVRLLGAKDLHDAEHKLRNILAGRDMALRLVDEQKERMAALTAEVEELTALDASLRETIALQEADAEKREREFFELARLRSEAEATLERQREYIATLEQLAKPEPLVFEPFDVGDLDSDEIIDRLARYFGSGMATREQYEDAADIVLAAWEYDNEAGDILRAIGWSGE